MSSNNPFAAQNPFAAGGFGGGYAQPQYHTGPAAAGAASAPGTGRGHGGGAPSGPLVYDVTEADFETAVLDRSMDVPVLLDCWAPWCGPCRSLGPILEKLAAAYGGRFVLAKLDTDQAPNIAGALRIRSIPLVMLFVGGQPVGQFVGAQPEGQIRAFLDKHLGPAEPQASPIDALREQAAAAATPEDAEALLIHGLRMDPRHPGLLLDLADRLSQRGALDDAERMLQQLPAEARDERAATIAKRIELARHRPEGDPRALAARILENPRDFEARYALGALHMHAGDWRAAFDALLKIVLRDKSTAEDGWRQKARRQLVEWFAVCPDAEAVSHGRRYLGMYLN